MSRQQPLYFRRPPDRDSFYGVKDLPDLAMRHGKWKLLCEYDGSDAHLYDLIADPRERRNVASEQPKTVQRLTRKLLAWHTQMPPDNGATYKRLPRKKPAAAPRKVIGDKDQN